MLDDVDVRHVAVGVLGTVEIVFIGEVRIEQPRPQRATDSSSAITAGVRTKRFRYDTVDPSKSTWWTIASPSIGGVTVSRDAQRWQAMQWPGNGAKPAER